MGFNPQDSDPCTTQDYCQVIALPLTPPQKVSELRGPSHLGYLVKTQTLCPLSSFPEDQIQQVWGRVWEYTSLIKFPRGF